MNRFNIVPFALPNASEGEFWFEESRDIREVEILFKEEVPRRIGVEYRRAHWPGIRVEERGDMEDPARFGWVGTDDWFNGEWVKGRARRKVDGKNVSLTFRGLKADGLAETPEGYDVDFRRTMGLRLDLPDWGEVIGIRIFTCSAVARSRLRVELDAGKRTPGKRLEVGGYNVRMSGFSLESGKGVGVVPRLVQVIQSAKGHRLGLGKDPGLELRKGRGRGFEIDVAHMDPAHRYCGDVGLVEFHLDRESFTISLEGLKEEGPVWYAEEGGFVALADDPTTFAEYQKRSAEARTINQRVAEGGEQSFAGAYFGQPRPHAEPYSFGCKHSPQRYWLEANGDLLLHKRNLTWLDKPGKSARRFLSKGNARFLFGLEEWISTGRSTDPAPVPVCNLGFKRGEVRLEQRSLCAPLERSILEGELGYDEVTVALVRFCFENVGEAPEEALLAIRYTEESQRSRNGLSPGGGQTEHLVPKSPLKKLTAKRGRITSGFRGKEVVRCAYETGMKVS
ncbi:MAG: hypothetical protein HOC74_30580, partial [Gemmatimonadetes bacterium]|nr:hypothetical protein [Gemmatimonadota bacterium]